MNKLPRATKSSDAASFDWPLAYEAENLIRERLAEFLKLNNFAANLAARMHVETGTDFFEWVDHLVLSPDDETALVKTGFIHEPKTETPRGEVELEHPRATLPRVLLRRTKQSPAVVAIKPEFVAEFIAALGLSAEPDGEPRSRYRRVVAAEENGTRLEAVERRAYRGFVSARLKRGELEAITKAKELFLTRPRRGDDDAEGCKIATHILNRALKLVDRDVACHLFFEGERAYWENRNPRHVCKSSARINSASAGAITIIIPFVARARTSPTSSGFSTISAFRSASDFTPARKPAGARRFPSNRSPGL